MARIETIEALRAILPEPGARTFAKVRPLLDSQAHEFLALSPFAVLTTADAEGRPEASPKGDVPGFIRVESPTSVVVPERTGNNMAIGLRNIIETGRAGLLVVLPGTSETLRISGTASLDDDPELLAAMSLPAKPALLGIRIEIERAFFHCARSFLRAGLWKPETWPERKRVSFGKVFEEAGVIEAADSAKVDSGIDDAYSRRLWSNNV
ncbi:MSMEG_1061 family FMN-dependent PPOX-type flavoprotein [Oceanicella sp. SM1341]|uniref:MSMEG_1061 family FMN-dependent PPOX-type flavoprotein n=1 Tax=Oceanicella sp. SM1341 TaxID=1548889 RepID=UPI0013009AF4|nr:MSMEG_1061 family FMN-dependent PPOX-type flavoprotein [Oceanicella sp. SM1341]